MLNIFTVQKDPGCTTKYIFTQAVSKSVSLRPGPPHGIGDVRAGGRGGEQLPGVTVQAGPLGEVRMRQTVVLAVMVLSGLGPVDEPGR